jgi:hypothetical protein
VEATQDPRFGWSPFLPAVLHPGVIAAFAAGFAALLLGSASPDERLMLGGIPLPPFIYILLGFVAFLVPLSQRVLTSALLIHAPLAMLAITAMDSWNAEYGLWKLANLLASSLIATLAFAHVIREAGFRPFLKLLVAGLSVLMVLGISYKVPFGLFDRSVHFFLNGPIVFARLMGIGAICAFFAWETPWRHVLVFVFGLAVVITLSNGPLIALVISLTMTYLLFGSRTDKRVFLTSVAFGVAAAAIVIWYFSLEVGLGRLGLLFEFMAHGFDTLDTSFTSANTRLAMYVDTVRLIVERPFGVGLGGWEGHVAVGKLFYPHNLVLELISECGFILGTFALIPFILFFVARSRALLALGIFLFLAQQVSGDLNDARHLLCFSALAMMHRLGMLGAHRAGSPLTSV